MINAAEPALAKRSGEPFKPLLLLSWHRSVAGHHPSRGSGYPCSAGMSRVEKPFRISEMMSA